MMADRPKNKASPQSSDQNSFQYFVHGEGIMNQYVVSKSPYEATGCVRQTNPIGS